VAKHHEILAHVALPCVKDDLCCFADRRGAPPSVDEYVKEEYSAVPPEAYETSIPVPPVSTPPFSFVRFVALFA